MPYSLEDLTEVMETRSAGGRPSPDLLPRVRRRIRRGDRRRAAGGAAGAALAVAAAFGAVQQFGQASGDGAPPAMTGVVNEAFPKSSPSDGLAPVREVEFSTVGVWTEIDLTPTGTYSMIAYSCPTRVMIYHVINGHFGGGPCGGRSYLPTTPDKPVKVRLIALPLNVAPMPKSHADLDRYAATHRPGRGKWRVRLYSGTCQRCKDGEDPAAARNRRPVKGLKLLAGMVHTADGRPRTIAFTPPPAGRTVRFRVTCVDGAAVMVVRGAGRPKIVDCEPAEARGVFWLGKAEPGERNRLTVAVLPAEAGTVTKGDDASLAAKMKGVEPAGRWTFEVYEG
ncbi:hypothetical protein [Actinomadura sp. B10D3]|uniref:hypothetical protein n=1 Tax=Actinomadura sp. B10D3 TaxID=3153557 RepID=UPI00325EC0AD